MSYQNRNKGHGRGPRNQILSLVEENRDSQIRMERMIRELFRRSGIELEMEFEQMVNLEKLVTEVEETRGAAASTKVLVKGLYAKIKELKVDDPAQQAKIDELAASLQAAQDELASAVETEPSPGGSTGGITE